MNTNQRSSFPAIISDRIILIICTIWLIFPVQNAFAVTCHCFKEREFKPSQPASADLYILATTRNSLLAAASGIEKGSVVKQRMTGVTETDLWLSHYLSGRVDQSAGQLLDARDKAPSWAAALNAMDLDTGSLGAPFNEARKNADDEGMARALAEPVMEKAFGAASPTLGRLKNQGADIAETAGSLYLAAKLRRTPESVFSDVRKGETTWGELFNSLGIRIDTVGDLIAREVKRKG